MLSSYVAWRARLLTNLHSVSLSLPSRLVEVVGLVAGVVVPTGAGADAACAVNAVSRTKPKPIKRLERAPGIAYFILVYPAVAEPRARLEPASASLVPIHFRERNCARSREYFAENSVAKKCNVRAIHRSTRSALRPQAGECFSMSEARKSPTPSSAESPRKARGLTHTLRYFSRFGFKGGMQAARVHRPSSQPISVRIPRLAHPLWVRPGSADAATFDEVFVAHEYDLPLGDFTP